MRTLVTGHSGYIGTVLVPMLQSEGHEVVGLDADLHPAPRLASVARSGITPR